MRTRNTACASPRSLGWAADSTLILDQGGAVRALVELRYDGRFVRRARVRVRDDGTMLLKAPGGSRNLRFVLPVTLIAEAMESADAAG